LFRIKEINVAELKKRFDENFSFTLLDVREHYEVEFAKIEPHVHIPMGRLPVRQEEIDKEKPIIVICHTGVRSARGCQYLEPLG
jgi:rhodanese-related sulfurtransferase